MVAADGMDLMMIDDVESTSKLYFHALPLEIILRSAADE
jgi:hypothetical protein